MSPHLLPQQLENAKSKPILIMKGELCPPSNPVTPTLTPDFDELEQHQPLDSLLKRQVLVCDTLLKRQDVTSSITGHLQNIINQLVDIVEQTSSPPPLLPTKQDERSNIYER